jgi:hypothetical protein
VRQVGHLPELYKDARSEKYKIMEAEFSSLFRNLSFVSSTHEKNLFFFNGIVSHFKGCYPVDCFPL